MSSTEADYMAMSEKLLKKHFIREAVSNKFVKVLYLKSADMPADVLTKSLVTAKHVKMSSLLGISKNL